MDDIETLRSRTPSPINEVRNEQPVNVDTITATFHLPDDFCSLFASSFKFTRKPTYKKAYSNLVENIDYFYLGTTQAPHIMTMVCKQCSALYFDKEVSSKSGDYALCCGFGSVKVDPLQPCPPELKELLTSNTRRANEFRTHIRAMNSLFAMANFKPTSTCPKIGQGPWCFRVRGTVNHFTQPIPRFDGEETMMLNQYYFLEEDDALDRRSKFFENRMSVATLKEIEHMLRLKNPLVQSYSTLSRIIQARTSPTPMCISFYDEESIKLLNEDIVTTENAALFFSKKATDQVPSLLTIHESGKKEHLELKNLNCLADPMVYPLLFPSGEYGHRIRTKLGKKTKAPDGEVKGNVTLRQFYRYRLMIRRGELESSFSILHNAGKLFQQFVVDSWIRVEMDRLWYIRQNPAKFSSRHRSSEHRIELPASFIGGPRYRKRQYLDAISIAMKFGKPDLFITMTCNPRWPEIAENLEFAQTWEHRPDLVCRVFHTKLLELINDLWVNQVFGVPEYYIYSIEFQKSGLPHAHILLSLKFQDRITSTDGIDDVICATFPDPVTEPVMFAFVKDFMVHGPCGKLKPSAPCMKDGLCSKGFPKSNAPSTFTDQAIRPVTVYKRPMDARCIWKGNIRMDNTWVVPHNKYLLAKYRSHINVEICNSLLPIRYIFKQNQYEQDVPTTCSSKKNENDEINKYLSQRSVTAIEGIWRLFEYRLNDKSHSVVLLAVHLPDFSRTKSTLTAWFDLNKFDPSARNLRYVQIPEHYAWDNKNSKWCKRQRPYRVIGVLPDISTKDNRFHLRMILSVVRGATSFEDLKTVDGESFNNYKSVCIARNLLEDVHSNDFSFEEITSGVSVDQLHDNILNEEQLMVFTTVMNTVRRCQEQGSYSENIIFVEGLSGSGKTFLLNEIGRGVRSSGKSTLAVSWTGITAGRLFQGNTVHATFKLPLDLNIDRRVGIGLSKDEVKQIKESALIIWDEAQMAPKDAVEAVDHFLRKLMKEKDAVMGGKTVVFAGDFKKLLPVVSGFFNDSRRDITIRNSYMWPLMKIHTLTENHRSIKSASEGGNLIDFDFIDFIRKMGEGNLPHPKTNTTRFVSPDMVEIPGVCGIEVENMVDFVYGPDFGDCTDSVILCTTLLAANSVNFYVLSRFDGPVIIYTGKDDFLDPPESEKDMFIPQDMLNSIDSPRLPPYRLFLKTGAVVYLVKNLDVRNGLTYGTRLVVLESTDTIMTVKIISGCVGDPNRGRIFSLGRMSIKSGRETGLTRPFVRFQFPVRLAFAIPIEKSQGQTFKRIGLFLDHPVSVHGELYLAFSRVGSFRDIRVLISDGDSQGVFGKGKRMYTRNVVCNWMKHPQKAQKEKPKCLIETANEACLAEVSSETAGGRYCLRRRKKVA